MTDSRIKLIFIPDADGAASSFKCDHGVCVFTRVCRIACLGLTCLRTSCEL